MDEILAHLKKAILAHDTGGAITEDFAKLIGADGYEPTVPGAVRLFQRLVGKGE